MNNNQYYLNQLTNEELMLVNSEVEKQKKSAAVAYLLCLFLGTVGGHRYYMRKTGSAVAMTLITVLTLGFGILITGIWEIVDLFLISGWLREDQNKVEEIAAQDVLSRRNIRRDTTQTTSNGSTSANSNDTEQEMASSDTSRNNQSQDQ